MAMLRDLTAQEAAEVLDHETSARLYDDRGRRSVLAVRYCTDESRDLLLDGPHEGALRRSAGCRVRIEVDEVAGPQSWKTVLGWGELVSEDVPAGSVRYRLRLCAVRGFGRTPRRAPV